MSVSSFRWSACCRLFPAAVYMRFDCCPVGGSFSRLHRQTYMKDLELSGLLPEVLSACYLRKMFFIVWRSLVLKSSYLELNIMSQRFPESTVATDWWQWKFETNHEYQLCWRQFLTGGSWGRDFWKISYFLSTYFCTSFPPHRTSYQNSRHTFPFIWEPVPENGGAITFSFTEKRM